MGLGPTVSSAVVCPRKVIALGILVVLGLLASGGPTRAVVPGANGQILFARCIARSSCFDQSSSVPSWEIVAADPNDTHETVLAGPYPRSVWDDHFIANWSPDGRKAIFMADLGTGQAIWQVNADGSGLHKVWSPPPDGTGIDDGPTFTPDGKSIIFTRCCPQDSGYSLWKINSDGTGLLKVTTEIVPPGVDGPSDNLPQVSPGGMLIAFHRNVVTCADPSDCGNRIVTVNINEGNRVQLTDPALEAQIPNWSPDGKKIVFEMFPEVNGQFTANIATTRARWRCCPTWGQTTPRPRDRNPRGGGRRPAIYHVQACSTVPAPARSVVRIARSAVSSSSAGC
jgi:WD40-like Beta Propeller Repeat